MSGNNIDSSLDSGTVNLTMTENHGKIVLYIGPMFASKSSALIAEVRRNMVARKRCAIIKYRGDTRYTESPTIVSHDGVTVTAPLSITAETLNECTERIANAKIQVVGIDEGQFFPDLADYADAWANAGIEVVIAALDGDYKRKPFKSIVDVIPLAEEVIKLKAVCVGCYNDNASFTHRLVDADGQVLVGGTKEYAPMCRRCYPRD